MALNLTIALCLDNKVMPELVVISAEQALPHFKTALAACFPDGDKRFAKLYGPVKLADRVGAKVCEYRDEGKATWPFISKARTLLTARRFRAREPMP